MEGYVQTKIVRVADNRNPFTLENGSRLSHLDIAYEMYGRLNPEADNVILICHALSGDAHAAGAGQFNKELVERIPFYRNMKNGQKGWWDGVIGPGKAFDTRRFCVICSNILGSCYGSTGPASINPETGKPYGPRFPVVTVRDMVQAQYLFLKKIGVNRLHAVAGGSLGGMQVLEWALLYPRMVKSIIPIATASQHSAWAVGFNHLARQAVENDPAWQEGWYREQPVKGLSLARKIGMISYRSQISFQERFGRERLSGNGADLDPQNMFQVDSYLNYQGKKLVNRFDANAFLTIIRAIDLHDVARGRGGLDETLARINIPALCIGIDSDVLYPAHEQQQIARCLPHGNYAELKSRHGHDAFLIEFDQMKDLIRPFLAGVS